MNFDLKKLSLGDKIILGSAVIAFIAILLPWQSLDKLGSLPGISDYAWIPLLLGWGPAVFMVLMPSKLKPVIAIGGGLFALIWGLIYSATAKIEVWGHTIYVGAFGIFLFIAAAAVLLFGFFCKYKSIEGIIAAIKGENK